MLLRANGRFKIESYYDDLHKDGNIGDIRSCINALSLVELIQEMGKLN